MMSVWLGQRSGASHGEAVQPTSTAANRFQTHASVIVNAHRAAAATHFSAAAWEASQT